jgi:hypothetical protein
VVVAVAMVADVDVEEEEVVASQHPTLRLLVVVDGDAADSDFLSLSFREETYLQTIRYQIELSASAWSALG